MGGVDSWFDDLDEKKVHTLMITVERFHQKLINKNIKNFVVQFANQFVDYVSDKKKQTKKTTSHQICFSNLNQLIEKYPARPLMWLFNLFLFNDYMRINFLCLYLLINHFFF